MKSFSNYLLSQKQSNTTVSMRLRDVYGFSNWCEDQQIDAQLATYNELLSYMQHLQKRGLKQRTIQMMLSSLKHYFKWVISCGIRETLPTEGIAVKNVQRKFLYHVLPMPELEKIYEQLGSKEAQPPEKVPLWQKQAWFTGKTQKVVFGLMIWQGMDISELARLTIADLKLREGKIYIAGTRRSNERTLKLESVQIMDLMEYVQILRPEYLRTNPKPTDSLFISRDGGVWGSNFMYYLLCFVKTVNPQLTTFKQVRASVIIYWLKNYNLREAQYRAGHRYVSSTESYLVNDMDDLQEDITKFHPMG